MRNDRPSQIEKVIKERSKRKWWQRAVSILSAVAVFCTTYALILPAITWERSLVCEIPAHRHDESCYEMKIVPGEKELVCLETEHEHGPECYIITDNLICGIEESEGHSHSEACYEKELDCQIPEHVHSEDCWAEGESHEKMVLVCQLEEHEHTAACFDAPPAEDDGYYCGQIEHTHSQEQYCYFSDGSLRCTIPEHVHTLDCKSNPNADVESEAKWCSTFANVSLTGNWAEDVIAIANTQLGYTESTRNYEVQEDGTTIKGYTRYGNWYGNSYGDWCAMFCSFCMNYADVDSEIMPFEASCQRWVEKLTEKDMFRESIYYKGAKDDTTEYQPKPGDLIFFDWDEELDSDHVGLVYELIKDENDKVIEIKTIEGNNGNRVDYHTYEFTNSDIMGYGELPENPNPPVKELPEEAEPEHQLSFRYEEIPAEPEEPAEEVTETEEPAEEAEELPEDEALTEEPEETEEPELPDETGEPESEEEPILPPWMDPEDERFIPEIEEIIAPETLLSEEELPLTDALIERLEEGQKTIFSEAAEDGAYAVITGNLPEEAAAEIRTVTLSEEQLTEYLGEETAAAMTGYVAYDITILVDGEEWQPDETVSVVVKQPDLTVANSENFAVAHIDGETDTVSEIEAEVSVTGDITFETDGFSTYIFYTVEFELGDFLFSIEGGSDVLLSELFAALQIDRNAADAVSVVFSDETLIRVEQVEGDWNLMTLGPFQTEETLTVRFTDGTTLVIKVTDDYVPVTGAGKISHPDTDGWTYQNRLRTGANQDWAYFYHTDTRVNATYNDGSGNRRYTFKNGAQNTIASHEFDTIEYRDAFKYTDPYGVNHSYNICVKVKMNDVPSGTMRWSSLVYLNNSGGIPYLSIGNFTVNGGYPTNRRFDIDWELWLEDPSTHEKIIWAPLLGGSTYLGDREYVSVYSRDNTIYSNIPGDAFKYETGTLGRQGWHNNWGYGHNPNCDSPTYYALGMAQEDGVVRGRYQCEWRQDWGCEFTVSLYETTEPLVIGKSISGDTAHADPDEEYRFRVGFIDPFNGYRYTSLGKKPYSIYQGAISGTPVRTGTLDDDGIFTLKAGELIEIKGLPTNFVNFDISEYTDDGWSHLGLDYFGRIEDTTVSVNGNSTDYVLGAKDTEGKRTVTVLRTGDVTTVFNNKLKESQIIEIKKVVPGLSTAQKFDFTASVTDGEFLKNSKYTIDSDGKIRFQLASGDAPLKLYVSKGAKVSITETGHDGYQVKFTESAIGHTVNADTDTFTMNTDHNITVTNTPGAALPSTGGFGIYPLYALGALLVAGPIVYGCILRRKRERRAKE